VEPICREVGHHWRKRRLDPCTHCTCSFCGW
jgi:hypothetical protein